MLESGRAGVGRVYICMQFNEKANDNAVTFSCSVGAIMEKAIIPRF